MPLAEFIYTEILKPKPLKALANSILLRIIPQTLQVGPATLYLDPSDPVVSGALALRVFEPSELAFFQKHCRGGMTLVDIGANIGLYTVLAMHQLDATGCVIAFEPHSGTFALLQKNVEANRASIPACPRLEILNLAAASESGRQELRLNPENRGDNRLYRGTYQGKLEQWETLSIQGQPVDRVLSDLQLSTVNFVKIDIQGYEQRAISGFTQTLMRSPNVMLMSEFWPQGLREAGGDAIAYLEMLTDLGFSLYELKERPRGKTVRLDNWEALVARLPGRKYTNIIGVKGYAI